MKLNREHIVVGIVLLLVVGTLTALYYVYYVPRQKVFKENDARRVALETAIQKFEKTFFKTKPEAVIKTFTESVAPFQEELMSRSKIYNVGDFFQIDPIPENRMLRFYYTDLYNKMMMDLRREAYTRSVYIPEVLNLGIAKPEDLSGSTMTRLEVRTGLKRLKFAGAMLRMLMDAKAQYITEFSLWPSRKEFELLSCTTVGVTMMMTYKDLADFLEKMRTHERFFSVNALSIQNPYMLWQAEPPLSVKMVITQAAIIVTGQPEGGGAGQPAPGGAPVQAAVPGGPAPVLPAVGAAPQTPEEQLRNANIMLTAKPKREVPTLTTGQKIKRFLRSWYLWPF